VVRDGLTYGVCAAMVAIGGLSFGTHWIAWAMGLMVFKPA